MLLTTLLVLLSSKNVIGDEVKRISNANDFSYFVNDVNSGISDYSGTTVYLDSDLSLSEINEPIGPNSTYQFRGTFDGQGHIISDLKMNFSSSYYTGLFGYSKGLTIRNVVLDSSCSITNSYSGKSGVHVGGIIGECYGKCNIENNMNMADVTFSGNISSYPSLCLGGLVGYFKATSYSVYVKNCANYGSVAHSVASFYSYIGGIVGDLSGSSPYYAYVQNCLNYGTITHSGTTSITLYLGGIAGYSKYSYIENCVSAGKISTQNTPSNSYVGSIVGYILSSTSINYCYYTSDLSGYETYGRGMPSSSSYTLSYDSTTFELSETVSVGSYTGTSLINTLNAAADYYFLRDYSKWLLNKEEKSMAFIIDSRASPITMNYQIILLPSLASEGNISFDGWYNDDECTYPLESFEITGDKTLYGRFEENTNKYTITFDTRGEGNSVSPITAQFGTVVPLPSDSTREHCSVAFWENKYGDNVGLSLTMPAHNFTLYAVWKCTHIKTPEDFIDFSKVVNSGTDDYNGVTVYLDSDLSLYGKTLEPIGKDINNYYFNGVFDGQGHIISNLKMSSSTLYTGLFGYSNGMTIRNVVLDSSCTITSSYSGYDDAYVGGIIGYCSANKKQCNIENSVNMADVTASNNIDLGKLYLGGISGELYSDSSYESYVKNCANYGSVIHSGTSYKSYIGGIAGYLYGPNSYNKYVYNCLNYGEITHSGTSSSELGFGGIAGYSFYTYIKNCVSAGKVSIQNNPSEDSYIGSAVGEPYSTDLDYFFYTSDVGISSIYGSGSPSTTAYVSSVSSSTINTLDYCASENGFAGWLYNENNEIVSFNVNGNKGLTLSSSLIILPDLVSDWRSFVSWYTDDSFKTLFSGLSVTSSTTLYGRWDTYAVTFDTNGGNASETSRNVAYDSKYGELPEANKTGYTFLGWFTEKTSGSEVSSSAMYTSLSDIILYAHWSANHYVVTFDVNGGNELTENETTVTFDETYGTLPETSRTGYTFDGWFTEKVDGAKVTSEAIFNNTANITLYAHWEVNNYTVRFIFSNGVEDDVRVLGYNATVVYPTNPEKEGHTFASWDINVTNMPEYNLNITAQWSINNYTVTLDVNGGNELADNKMTVTFNERYGTLPEATKGEHMFMGWFTEKVDGAKVTNETIFNATTNITLYAHWEKVTSQVEIVFNTKDISKKDIEEIVKGYVEEGTKFTIVEIESDNSDEKRVVIKFVNAGQAEEFVRNVNELSKDGGNNLIKRVSFVSYDDDDGSLSSMLYPIHLLLVII